ncbi:TIGR00730 family Rossman fold protein [bacterium]|nr:TIGR00730 family Rossman fold protein [bacterium]
MNNNLIKNICVFCSASDHLDEIYYKDAKELGTLIGKNNFNIVYGGSTLGMMWACASEVKAHGGRVFGVMPKKLIEMGCRTDNCDEFYSAEGMRDRKEKMDKISQAVIVMAGGFGTLDEFAEMFVQKQLGYNKKPIVVLNTNGYYDSLLDFFNKIVDEKFANEFARKNIIYVAKTPQEAIEYIKNYKEPDFTPSKHEIYAR